MTRKRWWALLGLGLVMGALLMISAVLVFTAPDWWETNRAFAIVLFVILLGIVGEIAVMDRLFKVWSAQTRVRGSVSDLHVRDVPVAIAEAHAEMREALAEFGRAYDRVRSAADDIVDLMVQTGHQMGDMALERRDLLAEREHLEALRDFANRVPQSKHRDMSEVLTDLAANPPPEAARPVRKAQEPAPSLRPVDVEPARKLLEEAQRAREEVSEESVEDFISEAIARIPGPLDPRAQVSGTPVPAKPFVSPYAPLRARAAALKGGSVLPTSHLVAPMPPVKPPRAAVAAT